MTSIAVFNACNPWVGCIAELPIARALWLVDGGAPIERQPLPTDAVGSMTLTLQNIAVGSAWRLEVLGTGATVATGTAPGGDIAQAVSVYQPNQGLLLKVRKGTASPYYRPFDTQVTITPANVSIFVSQIPDE